MRCNAFIMPKSEAKVDNLCRKEPRDRDQIYGEYFHNGVRNMGFEEVVIAARSPWHAAFRPTCYTRYWWQ